MKLCGFSGTSNFTAHFIAGASAFRVGDNFTACIDSAGNWFAGNPGSKSCGTYVGTVDINFADGNFWVTYNVAGYLLKAHVNVGCDPNAEPAPGQMTVVSEPNEICSRVSR